MTTQVEINILYLCIFFLIDLDYKHLVEKQNISSVDNPFLISIPTHTKCNWSQMSHRKKSTK